MAVCRRDGGGQDALLSSSRRMESQSLPAPGVSLLDAFIFVWAGYYGSMRTGRFSTGIVTSAVTSLLGVTMFFIAAAVTRPSLLLAPFEKPFIFVIVAVLLGWRSVLVLLPERPVPPWDCGSLPIAGDLASPDRHAAPVIPGFHDSWF